VSDVTAQRTGLGGRELIGTPCSWAYLAGKRCMDLAVGSILIVVLSPLMLLIALAIRIDTPGRALFVQERVGARPRRRNGRFVWQVRPFKVYKFRSMVNDADPQLHRDYVRDFVAGATPAAPKAGLQAKLVGDPRVTRVGRLLRRTSLDELPQLFNVVTGSMSIVGPRPVPDYEVECYSEAAYERLTAQPGITGPWQVEGRGRVSFEEMLELDLGYVRRRSLLHDAALIVRTVPAVLGSKGAR
jgi:exopolysaccharide production protein ExoY